MKQAPLTVSTARYTRRVLPSRFKKAGSPSLQSGSVLRGDGWHGLVISTWSVAGSSWEGNDARPRRPTRAASRRIGSLSG